MQLTDWKHWLHLRGIDANSFSIRDMLNENPVFVYIAVGLLTVTALSLVVCQSMGGGGSAPSSHTMIYYDASKEVLRVIEHDFSAGYSRPVLEDGLVEAVIYTCGEQEPGLISDGMSRADLENKGLFIAWLQRMDPNASEEDRLFEMMIQYKLVDSERWLKANDPGVNQILNAPAQRCPDAMPYRAW